MNEGITVLSLFDGISCGQLALDRLGVKVKSYYASEVDKYAMGETQRNYPDTVQIGDVTKINTSSLPKIDILIGGSPCQGFSFAGHEKGMVTQTNVKVLTLDHYLQLKEKGFEFDGQSYLFWEYIRILKAVKPKYFLLENVKMSSKWKVVLSRAIGCNPIFINSKLVSAQSRPRLYWTNIGQKPFGLFGDMKCEIPQPKDKRILLKHILQEEVHPKYFISGKKIGFLNGHSAKTGNKFKVFSGDEKCSCLTASEGKHNLGGNYVQHGIVKYKRTEEARLVRKINLAKGKDYSPFKEKEIAGFDFDKSSTLTTSVSNDNLLCDTFTGKIRRLTPVEYERLQTLPDGYTDGASDSQRYKMIGNGWNVDTVVHILSFAKF